MARCTWGSRAARCRSSAGCRSCKGFSNLPFKTTYQVVNTGRLAELYPQGGDVTPEDLVAKGAVRAGELVKVLGEGDDRGGPASDRPRVLGLGPGEDHCSRGNRH